MIDVCPHLPAGFCGVEVCAKTTVLVTNSPQNFVWEGYGLKLNIPKGSLPAGMDEVIIYIQASLSGHYAFPENSHLVSAVVWLHCKPRCTFSKPVHLELHHCAKSENISKLRFAKAVCSQRELPYLFQYVGGKFNMHSSYGILELESFSGMGIVQDGSDEREYCAMLFYFGHSLDYRHNIDFVVVWNSETHLAVSIFVNHGLWLMCIAS